MAMIEHGEAPADKRHSRKWWRGAGAAVLSLFFPGSSQIYAGQYTKGFLICSILLIAQGLMMWTAVPRSFAGFVALVVLSLFLQLASAIDAYLHFVKNTTIADSTRTSRWMRWTLAGLAILLVSASSRQAVNALPFRAFVLPANSMAPTIQSGDRIIADMRYYRTSSPERGDVAVFLAPSEVLFVKRIMGLGGDVIRGEGGKVFVNGTLVSEPYAWIGPDRPHATDPFGPVNVPQGEMFVLGDNRGESWDSRYPDFGLVGLDRLRGKALFIYWSRDKSRIGRPIN